MYETYVNCRTNDGNWHHFSQCFHPTKNTKKVTEIRIMLYAYWPPGEYWFDNVSLRPVDDEEYLKDKRENE